MTRANRLLPSAFLLYGLVACRHPTAEETPALTVRTIAVASGSIAERLELRARLVPPPERDTTIAPQVAGRLALMPVREGEVVVTGQLLAIVESAGLDEAARAAEAGLDHARQEEAAKTRSAELTRGLLEKGIASAEEKNADQAAAAAATAARSDAEARLSQARRQRGWARVVAPFAGVVVALLRHQGETVDGTPTTPILRLASTERTEAAAKATAPELTRVKVGDPAQVEVADKATPAHVAWVAQAVDPVQGVGEIRAVLAGPPPAPLFSEVSLKITIATHADALIVPVAAVRRSEEGTDEVVVVERGVAHVRPVRLGLRSGAEVEVLAGLRAGEVLVADEPLGISDGAVVKMALPAGS